jgi:hypothetical protein
VLEALDFACGDAEVAWTCVVTATDRLKMQPKTNKNAREYGFLNMVAPLLVEFWMERQGVDGEQECGSSQYED